MADYTKQIFELLGVEPFEEFKLWYFKDNMEKRTFSKSFMIDEELNVHDFITKEMCGLDDPNIQDILTNFYHIVKIPHPTVEEQLAIDYARACGYFWLTKDKKGTIVGFSEKPRKEEYCWYTEFGLTGRIHIPISFLHWEDEEPYYIGDWQCMR